MPRKNIFQLVEENYDVKSEIEKINELFSMKYYFAKDYLDGLSLEGVSFERIIEDYLFDNWKYRGTCISIEEYFSCANADIDSLNTITEEEIINNLEVMENFVKLYFDNKNKLYREHQVHRRKSNEQQKIRIISHYSTYVQKKSGKRTKDKMEDQI